MDMKEEKRKSCTGEYAVRQNKGTKMLSHNPFFLRYHTFCSRMLQHNESDTHTDKYLFFLNIPHSLKGCFINSSISINLFCCIFSAGPGRSEDSFLSFYQGLKLCYHTIAHYYILKFSGRGRS